MDATTPYPVEPWSIRETALDLDRLAQSESIFALANGHLGLRGNLDEGEPVSLSGTYLNGFYESWPIAYGETAFGFPQAGQTLIDVTNGKVIRLLIEDEPLDVHRGSLQSHERVLDLRSGLLERRLVWRSIGGRTVRLTSRRLVSFRYRSLAAISYELEALDEPLRVAVQSDLLANESQATAGDDPRSARALHDVLAGRLHAHDGLRVVLAHTTHRSGLTLASGMDHRVLPDDGDLGARVDSSPDLGRVAFAVRLEPGRPLRLEKYLSYHWSSRQSVEWLRDQVDGSLVTALAEGFDGLAAAQRAYLDEFWERADIELDGDPALQQAVRFALFQTLQAAARAEERAIAAKGLTGTGYDGHAFWDTESLVLPMLTYTMPGLARSALIWRSSTLDLARERAGQSGLRGAAFPWRTIHGEECSAYWPAGLAAFHVNADIADAVGRYLQVTHDDEFEERYGAELLVETARLWASLGHFADDGSFRIDGVTGPDEYSALADNNVYTNLMARANLRAALESLARRPQAGARLGVSDEERAQWAAAADAMYVPRDPETGLHPQDQDFLLHERWDFASTAADDYPLMLHYPYFDLYRKQVVKQADLVLALYRCSAAFSAAEKRRDFDYYEGVTVRDSSLSAAPQAMVAAEVGHLRLAYDYLREAAFTDLHDLGHNIRDGLHVAALGGAVLAVVAGLGGLRDDGEHLAFSPRLPDPLTRLRFRLTLAAGTLEVAVEPARASYALRAAQAALRISHWGEELELEPGGEVSRPVPPAPPLSPPRQPRHRVPPRSDAGDA